MNREGQPVSTPEVEEAEPDFGDMIGGLGRMMKRRKWLILLPLALVTAGVSQVALLLPNQYRSEATVGVVQQQVSQRYVFSDETPIMDVVAGMQQEILSRASLVRIIEELDLYGDRSGVSDEDLAARMQDDLNVEVVEARRDQITALRISFTAETPKVAQRVASRLTDAFIQENVKQRDTRTETTKTFLDEEVRAAEAKLAAQEQRLQSYKTRNLEQLPEQQNANLGVLADLRNRLQAVAPNVDQARRSLRLLEGQVSDRLTRLQQDRADLSKKYAPQHPVLVKLDGDIARYTALREVFGASGLSAKARQVLAGNDDPQIGQIRNQAEEYANDIDKLRRQEAQLQDQINDYQGRVSAAPLREQEQSAILRDYNLLKADYEGLKAKQLASGLATNLDQKEEGGQKFRLIESASFPTRPTGPKRLRFALGGAAGGLVFGLVLAFVLGSMDATFVSEKEVASAFKVPLVLGIPQILTPKEQSARTRKRVFDWVGGTALILWVISTEVYVYIKG